VITFAENRWLNHCRFPQGPAIIKFPDYASRKVAITS